MDKIIISKEKAKEFLVTYQGLNNYSNLGLKKSILNYISRVGCIQYDPLNVVGRNADLVLQSRIQEYKPDILHEMLYMDRTLIDGWDKMMSIYKTEDWYNFCRVRAERKEAVIHTLNYRDSIGALELIDEIVEIIKKNGPMQSNQINIGSGGKGRWGHKKLSSAALDYMYNIGMLGVYNKKNTQKVYDLIENILPKEILNHDDPFNDDRQFIKWYVERRIGSIGILWGKNGSGWLGHYISDKKIRDSILEELVTEGRIIKVYVEGISDVFYIRKNDMLLLEGKHESKKDEVRFLAPLDNLLWDRSIIEKIFDFSYTWEVYTPESKRKYGYYVLPVLYGNDFIARFEPELYRKGDSFKIKNWWWEKDIEVTQDLLNAVEMGLKTFCEYLGAKNLSKNSLKKITKL